MTNNGMQMKRNCKGVSDSWKCVEWLEAGHQADMECEAVDLEH